MLKINLRRCGTAAVIIGLCAMMITIRTESAEDKKHISYTGLSNDYIMYILGTDGAWQPEKPEGMDTIPHVTDENFPLSGRYEITRTGGNPDISTDDNAPLFIRHFLTGSSLGDKFAFWGLQVDDGNGGWVSFDTGGNAALLGAEPDGWFSDFPYTPTNKFSGLKVATLYPTANIRCDFEVRLMHDTVKFTGKIKNEDTVQHAIGMKLVNDVSVGNGWDYDPYVFVPGRNIIESETIIKGTDIPPSIEMFDNPKNPSETIRYIFNEQGATPPDVLGIDDWGIILGDAFSYFGSPADPVFLYEPAPNHPIDDLCLGALWKPRVVAPGQTVTFVHYTGLADATSQFNKPSLENPQYVTSIQGPRALAYRYSSTPGESGIVGDPFKVSAFMGNQEKYTDITNATASIILPDGLELDPSEIEGATKTIGKVSSGSENSVSWKVKTVGNPTGILEYSVSFNASPVGGSVLNRKINIPATPTQRMSKGWQMISMPFSVSQDPNSPPPAPGSAGDLSVLGLQGEYGVDYKLWEYDNKTNSYVKPDKLVSGKGYWLWCKASAQTTQQVDGWNYIPIQWGGTSGKQISLNKGWNLLGNPFVYTVTLGECYFYHPNFGTMPYEDAVKNGLISKTVYWYDNVYGKYRTLSDRTVQIKPWNGYWVKALMSSVTMLISPASQVGANLQGGIAPTSALTTQSDAAPAPAPVTNAKMERQIILK